MGARLLDYYGSARGSLRAHTIGEIKTVFPTTTSAAISALMTARPPGQHGILAWHMHMPRGVYTTLLSQYRGSPHVRSPSASELFQAPPIFSQLARDCFQIQPRYLVESPFSVRHRGQARALAAGNLNELFGQIAHVTASERPTFSYAYWPELDALGHRHGVASRAWRDALKQIDRGVQQLVDRLQGRQVSLIVTADHGMINARGGRCEEIDAMPDLKACLAAPLAGEPRAAFCRVEARKLEQFDALCAGRYSDRLVSLPTAHAFATGLFGPSPSDTLQARAGNRILLMQDNHTLVEVLPKEQLPAMIGVHGGLHPDEVDVPVIKFDID